MSLQDAVKDLRRIAKTLDAVKFNPQMNALEKFLDGIKVDKPAEPPRDVLEEVLRKFLRGDYDFSARELRALPFIIYEPRITSRDTAKILRLIDCSRASHLRRVLSVYLTNYDDSTKTEQLRQALSNVRNVDSVSLKKTFAARDNLFGDRRFENMTKLFAQRLSVEGSLASIGLSNFYKASNFIQAALKIFFRTNTPPATQFKLLEELDADYDAYRNINRSGFGKEQCIETFYRRLDDPRFGDGRIKWKEVSPKSKDIFSHWLSAEDLEIFFEIVNATAQDKQWKYREKFWRAYLPRIVKTKIFLGYDAKRLAAQIKGKVDLKNGDLRGATANQSVFVFQIGRYIFSEWSHNGKLRVHEVEATLNLFDTAEDFFEKGTISRDVLVENSIAQWIHSSPKTYSWQGNVSGWLREKCGIDKTEKDWGL